MKSATTGSKPAPTELHLPLEQRRHLEQWASEGHPLETCGLLVGRSEGDRVEIARVTQARNLNQQRASDRYELDPKDFLEADKAARLDGLDIVGFWHSHPDCPARPSTTDLEAAWDGYSYLIIGVTGAGDTDLHSWRLAQDLFLEETILPQAPRTRVTPTAAALRFENPLKEEQLS